MSGGQIRPSSTRITEYLCESDEVATVDDLTTWLTAYWARQFNATATEEWLASRDFSSLATELIAYRSAVESPAAHLQHVQWLRVSASGYTVTNEELLELVRLWTARLAEQLYQKWAPGSNCTAGEADCQHSARRLRQIAASAGYGETRRVMLQELLSWSSKVDSRGFLACLRGEVSRYTGSRKQPGKIDPETIQIQLQDCVSLFVECVLTQAALDMSYDWENFTGGAGDNSIN